MRLSIELVLIVVVLLIIVLVVVAFFTGGLKNFQNMFLPWSTMHMEMTQCRQSCIEHCSSHPDDESESWGSLHTIDGKNCGEIMKKEFGAPDECTCPKSFV